MPSPGGSSSATAPKPPPCVFSCKPTRPPGLPLIAAAGADPLALPAGPRPAGARPDPETRAALGLRRLRPADPTDYAIIAARLAAETRLRL